MCIGLQETNLKNDKIPSIKNYKIFCANRWNCTRAIGGVASLIHADYPSEQIPIHSDLEVITVQLTLESKITICNTYIPNKTLFKSSDIHNIITQLPKIFILFGDLNSHSVHWGSEKTYARGESIEKTLNNDSLVLLNNDQPTRLNPSNGTFSAIDLSISSSSLGQIISWSVLQEIYDSDHLPNLMTLFSTRLFHHLLPPDGC